MLAGVESGFNRDGPDNPGPASLDQVPVPAQATSSVDSQQFSQLA